MSINSRREFGHSGSFGARLHEKYEYIYTGGGGGSYKIKVLNTVTIAKQIVKFARCFSKEVYKQPIHFR